jgi:hypothetical protein
MERMRFRKLRIACSTQCGVFCLLLIAFWVRSYEYDQTAGIHGERLEHLNSQTRLLTVWSKLGSVHFAISKPNAIGGWQTNFPANRALGFGILTTGTSTTVRIPYWSLFIVALTVVGSPWLISRFSLRTLLIATTLVAVALGLIVTVCR